MFILLSENKTFPCKSHGCTFNFSLAHTSSFSAFVGLTHVFEEAVRLYRETHVPPSNGCCTLMWCTRYTCCAALSRRWRLSPNRLLYLSTFPTKYGHLWRRVAALCCAVLWKCSQSFLAFVFEARHNSCSVYYWLWAKSSVCVFLYKWYMCMCGLSCVNVCILWFLFRVTCSSRLYASYKYGGVVVHQRAFRIIASC